MTDPRWERIRAATAKEREAFERAQQKRIDAAEALERFNHSIDCTNLDRYAELTGKFEEAQQEEWATQHAYEEALERANQEIK